MTGPGRRRFWIIPVLVAGALLAAGFAPGGLVLRLDLAGENKGVAVLPVEPGERFTIRYFHSVENAPIWEEHSMDRAGTIYIEEERYEKFGAGMGKMPGIGRMVKKGKYEAIVDMHMPLGEFILRVGSPGVGHTLIWREKTYPLSRKFAHRAIRFSGERISFLHRVFYTLRPD